LLEGRGHFPPRANGIAAKLMARISRGSGSLWVACCWQGARLPEAGWSPAATDRPGVIAEFGYDGGVVRSGIVHAAKVVQNAREIKFAVGG
jgi:hypothetical protein